MLTLSSPDRRQLAGFMRRLGITDPPTCKRDAAGHPVFYAQVDPAVVDTSILRPSLVVVHVA